MNSINTSLAEQLIQQNMSSQSRILDLGNCGLTDSSPELASLLSFGHVKVINLGSYYYLAGKRVPSANKGAPNRFEKISRRLPPAIREIYINEVSLADISNLIMYAALTHFDAFGNDVRNLEILTESDNLISFGLSNNGLNNADQLEKFPNLKYLYLGNNQVTSFAKNLQEILPELETLHLYNNDVADIHFLRDHSRLKRLDLNSNGITNIHILYDLLSLEELDLRGNPIGLKIPPDVLQSKSAVEIRRWIRQISLAQLLINDSKQRDDNFLDLGNCGLTDSSPELISLAKCDHLTGVSLGAGYYTAANDFVTSKNTAAANVLTTVPPHLPDSLKSLQVRDSAIREISNVEHLTGLALLDLSNNKISKITNVDKLRSLQELALHRNVIESIEGVKFPPNVKVLHLSNNKIADLRGIEDCTALEELALYSNRLSSIFPVTKLPALRTISLSGNPISDCPSEIWTNNDVSQIKAYFTEKERLEKAPDPSTSIIETDDTATPDIIDVKLIILGNSNVGKTNLVHYLERSNFLHVRDSTHGLEVKRWKPDSNRFPRLKNIEVSVWDFGGQEYYHDSYKLFLSNNAVYVVLWSLDSEFNGKKEEVLRDDGPKVPIEHFELQYWLDTVKSFREENSNTPLIVVQNKVEDPLQKRRISQDLHSEYGINESFAISLKNGCEQPGSIYSKTLQIFTDYLADTIADVAAKNKEAGFSNDFKYIRQEVLNLSEAGKASIFGSENELFIEKERFYKICQQHRPNISAEHYPAWLHNGGALVYFEKNTLLNDRIFINPKKLSEEIFKVLNSEVLESQGEIAINDRTKSNQLIIDVMISLNILYPHPAKKTTHYLAPQYLPEEHPIEDLFKIASSNAWQDSYWIQIPLFFYKKMMHYLLLSFISDGNIDARYFWKNGIMILRKEPNSSAGKVVLIKGLFPSQRKAIIQVSVEDNSSDLQKEIFEKILGFSVNTAQNADPLKSKSGNEPGQDGSLAAAYQMFRQKLAVSVDSANFKKYSELEEWAQSPTADSDNNLLKFKHIVPLKIGGTQPKTIFVSYSHSNTVWLAKLRSHLAGLRRSNYIKEWTDQEILAGEKWDNKIKEQLRKSDIFILLLSAEFIASEYIWETELKEAIQSKKIIIPVYIESCDFTASPHINNEKISDYEIIPKDNNALKPISLWSNEAQALTVVATRIREAITGTI